MNPPGSSGGIDGTVPARSQDGNYLAVAYLGQTAEQMAVYSAATQTYIGSTPGQYVISTVAASPDGSQFVTVGTPTFNGGGSYITFWSRSLQQETQYATTDTNVVYSRDGKYLYVRNQYNVLALNTQTGQPAGYQGLSLATPYPGTLYDTDGSHRVYGLTSLGAFVASVGQLQPTPPTEPEFGGISLGNPNEGPLSGDTSVQFGPPGTGAGSADGISSTMEAYFGSVPATKDVVAPCGGSCSYGGNVLTATAPAASKQGAVTVLLTDANNNATFLPFAYSYGLHVLTFSPSALSPKLGAVSTLSADGIFSPGYDNVPIVTIDGAVAPAKPYGAWNEVQLTDQGGTPGWADLKLSLRDGTSETAKDFVQYLSQDVTLPSAAYTSAVYDPSRDRFYLTGANNTVAVFDPETQSFLQPMSSSAISSGAVLGSLALTPDDSKLLVTDPTDKSVVVFDLTNGTSSAVNLVVPSTVSTLSAPMPIAALAGNLALVIVKSGALDEVQEIDLTQMTARVRTDVPVDPSPVYSFEPSTIAASADGSVALLGGNNLDAMEVWKYDATSDTFSEPMIVPYQASLGDAVSVNSDGAVLSVESSTLDQNLRPLVPFPDSAAQVLTGSGALAYDTIGAQVLISDTRNGRLLLTVAHQGNTQFADAFAIDPSGQKILVCNGTSLHYYQLAVVPLAVATVSPADAAPGASLTVRGDGFEAGITAKIGGQSASCSLIDPQTLQCTLPNVNAGLEPMTLSDPDGQTYSFEAAVNVQ